MKTKKAQNEIVGFVLIVLLVMIIGLVFFIIMVRKPVTQDTSIEVENLLNALTKQTTGCAIVFEPDYDNLGDLIKSCYERQDCANLGMGSCEYLEKEMQTSLDNIFRTQGNIQGYELKIVEIGLEGEILGELMNFSSGDFKGREMSGEEILSNQGRDISVRLRLFYID
jgi:hypothetical protein